MAINIKNAETQRLSNKLAEITGESITTAVTVAVRERLDRVHQAVPTRDERVAKVLELGRQISAALGPNPMKVKDLDDDETGLPV